MSRYERGRRGNTLRGGARRHPAAGNTRCGQSGSGHLADPGRPRTQNRELAGPRSWVEPAGKPSREGVYASQRLSLTCIGKASGGKPRSELYSGNPTVQDRRGAWGIVGYGGIRNPRHNRKSVWRSLSAYGCARPSSIPTPLYPFTSPFIII